MTTGEEWIDLLDRLEKGMLTETERLEVDQKLSTDKNFQRFAEEHGVLLSALTKYGTRRELYALLDEAHAEIAIEDLPAQAKRSFLKYWYVGGIAASILMVIAVTFILTDRGNIIAYQELRRDISHAPSPPQIQPTETVEADSVVPLDSTTPDKNIQIGTSYSYSSDLNANYYSSGHDANAATYSLNGSPAPSGKYSGSGFFVSAKGFLATSYHVIRDADSVYVYNEKFGRRKVAVVYKDVKRDVAILELLDKSKLPLNLPYLISDKEAELGEGVYTLGYPRQDVVFGEGSISAQSGYLQNPNAYQISVPVNPGNSGGPLFNSQGNLVGIISGLQTQTYGAAFATKSSTLRHLLEEWEAPPREKKVVLPKRNALRKLTRVEQVKRWKNFVFVVEVYN